ncbi:putative manganese-dependent inorganic diphosphatase [Johnsonella ignava]|uniref:putative manganese-dependent inorganic diphosphatase n=1 Tax=Johnsonella ignava TaxID=43995 RepID=UPI0023F075CF|nr:putative manganese-dependent inorganic diphosphatase [Johnsonella ignava]
MEKKTIIIGHKNPDTDSICSAIVYAYFKEQTEKKTFEPARAGELNEETGFVLNYFGAEVPRLIKNVKTQVKDIEFRRTKGVDRGISIKRAWNLMKELDVPTLPVVNSKGGLEGIITVKDIASSYMNMYDNSTLSKANTKYENILDTLDAELITGDAQKYFNKGKVLIAAANPDIMEQYISEGDLVILGNRYESQLCAIEMGAACIVVCAGADASKTIKKLAQANNTTVMTTPNDTFAAAGLINQSMPISFFMTSENLITFSEDDYLDDIKEIMASVRHRYFPVLDKTGKYKGMISRRNLLGAKGKNIILVDHNEKIQAAEGVESANILEIIDHHRLGTISTAGPVYFRNQPLGCTSTIIYQMFKEKNIDVPPQMAGLMCSAIISDTLLFRSPTCTDIDKEAGLSLAKKAGINIEEYANKMFAAASNLKNKTDEQIFKQDYKRFTLGKINIGIGQISSLNEDELSDIKDRLVPYMSTILKDIEEDMIFLMLTNILEQKTRLICVGNGAGKLACESFRVAAESLTENEVLELPGVVSRKKQLVPALTSGAQAML